jgi:hypothetical protein
MFFANLGHNICDGHAGHMKRYVFFFLPSASHFQTSPESRERFQAHVLDQERLAVHECAEEHDLDRIVCERSERR